MECAPVFAGNQLVALKVGVPVVMTERVKKLLAVFVDRQFDELMPAFSGITPEEETALTLAIANLPNREELGQWWRSVLGGALEPRALDNW